LSESARFVAKSLLEITDRCSVALAGGAATHTEGGAMFALMIGYLRRHHVGVIALFVALGGTSYAAAKLPANSVGSKQIKPNAVAASEVKNRSLTSDEFKPGTLLQGATGPRGATGATGPRGPTGPAFVPDIFIANDETPLDASDPKTVTVPCDPGELAMGGYTITPPASGSIQVTQNTEVFDAGSGVSSWTVEAREVGVGLADTWRLHVDVNCMVVT
jgi:hypothetical protein